jgi:superfamily I DNA/RNA helicase
MKHKPTTEQQQICNLVATGKNLLIQALAGTGKTTTGKFIATSLPDKTCLSIFFNKKNAKEGMAQADRPSNMFYSTIHSLCYKQVMNAGFKSKLNNFLLFEDIDISLLVKLLGNEEAYGKGEYQKELNKLPSIVLDCMRWWQQSDGFDCFNFVSSLHPTNLGFRRDFGTLNSIEELDLVVITDEIEEDKRREYLAKTCEKLWAAMTNPADKVKITHDTYVKIFQLRGLTFDQVYDEQSKSYKVIDLLILDEVQDSNAVTLAIFNNQTHLQRIACGDKNQNLYAWRGAKNDFTSFKNWNKASLTESFRFGQDIANLANKVLALPIRDTKLRLVGRGTDKGTGQTAILCRTNATVLQTVFTLLLQGEKVACVSKFSKMKSTMYHVLAVLNEQVPTFPVASLKSFDTKDKMWQAIEGNAELKQVYNLANLIADAKGGLFNGLKYLKENLVSQEKATYVVSTIHASKGLGFTKVIISDDFLVPKMVDGEPCYEDAIADMLASNSMTALLYVAISRAMKEVVLPWYLESLFES